MPPPLQLFCLVGPTAVGKTEVAHRLAERMDLPIVSADSMMVYRGLDIGTAKPFPAERARYRYYGLDLVEANRAFSVSRYRKHVADSLRAAGVHRAILCGGTGLYVKALLHGLTEGPRPDLALRTELEAVYALSGLPALRARLETLGAWGTIPPGDQSNPRRLLRALERAIQGVPADRRWAETSSPVLAGLAMDRPSLVRRIEKRVRSMYRDGLLREAKEVFGSADFKYEDPKDAAAKSESPILNPESRILNSGPRTHSDFPTSTQAIGYAEALAVLSGRLSEADAISLTATRTRQYAKRQETWFRRQEKVEWVHRTPENSVDDLSDAVADIWQRHGPAPFDTEGTSD